MDRDVLISVIFDQQEITLPSNFVSRISDSLLQDNQIIVLSGVRRCGKSTLLKEIRLSLAKNNYYLNFDDDRLIHFTVDDFQQLYELFIEHFGVQNHFFFDEIQNINGWERFVRRLHDNGSKVFVTGSNASMLSRELGTHLTGRFYQFELFPFSFKEFLLFNNRKFKIENYLTSIGRAEIKNYFNEYFLNGGFPSFLQSANKLYLKSLYESILYRDIIVRNGLTNEKELLELVYFLASNVSKPASFNSLSKVIGVKNATTVKNYLDYIQNTYLLFAVNKYDYSLKSQIQNPKKIYFIDLALIRELGFQTSEDNGRMLENLVFIELRRRLKDIYYHRGKLECDFILRDKNRVVDAIQVSWSIQNAETRAREINGLMEAIKTYNLKSGTLLTNYEEESLQIDDIKITIKPVWKWLLE